MSKIKLLLGGLLALALAGAAHAVDVPEGKAAVATAVLGKVKLKPASGPAVPLELGRALDYGDQIVTGPNGRASLRLASDAVTRLAPNTELTLEAPGARKGTFLALAKGWVRFLVGQRAPGEAFEVRTANAVAAVKGTDGEVGQEDGSHVRVYDSEHHPAMGFHDPGSGKGLDLDPGQGADYNGSVFTKIEHLEKLLGQEEKRYHGLPAPTPIAGPGKGGPQGQAPAPGPDATLLAARMAELMKESINKVVTDTQRDIKIDHLQSQQQQKDDMASGRMGVDAGGYPVQITNYVIRPDPASVDLIVVNQRNGGPNAGVSEALESTTWNTALPTDWMGVARMNLNDPANIDPATGDPLYWRTSMVFHAGNPSGDALDVINAYDTPFFLGQVGPGNPLFQTWSQFVYVTSGLPAVTPTQVNAVGGSNATLFTAYSLVDQNVVPDPNGGAFAYDPYVNSVGLLYRGNLQLQDVSGSLGGSSPTPTMGTPIFDSEQQLATYYFQDFAFSGNYLVESLQALDANGVAQPMPIGAVQSNAPVPGDFKGLDPALNLEVSFNWVNANYSPLFAQPIDLLFMPQFFDTMQMLVFPQPILPPT